jgi:threonine/homoserine/homoserine lactone efflux protein
MIIAALLGFAFGFVGSMPVAGPISLLVFGRGLQDRARSGAYLAAGAAIAESVYAYLAFWGFSELLASAKWVELLSRGLAAVLLTGLGIHFVRRSPAPPPPPTGLVPIREVGHKRSFMLGFTITALNPTLVASWGAAVTTLHSFHLVAFGPGRALPFSIGVCLGITSWFWILLGLLARYRNRFQASTVERVVGVMGVGLIGLGLFFAVRFIQLVQTSN